MKYTKWDIIFDVFVGLIATLNLTIAAIDPGNAWPGFIFAPTLILIVALSWHGRKQLTLADQHLQETEQRLKESTQKLKEIMEL